MFMKVDDVGAERMSSGRLFQANRPVTRVVCTVYLYVILVHFCLFFRSFWWCLMFVLFTFSAISG